MSAEWIQWAGSDPFAQDPQGLRELIKALEAGSDIANPGASAGEGFPLRVESLDETMRLLVHSERDLVSIAKAPKKRANQTIEEFNQLSSVGAEGGSFIAEGDLPNEVDSTYVRNYVRMKYMGVVKRITDVMARIRNVPIPGGVMAAENRSGALKLLRDAEIAYWNGDSTLSDVQYNGFEANFIAGVNSLALGAHNNAGSTAWHTNIDACLTANLAQDMRYSPMDEEAATDLITTVAEDPNHGQTTDIFYGFGTHRDFSKQFYPKERVQGLVHQGAAGVAISNWISPFGNVALNPVKYIRTSTTAVAAGTGDPLRRPAPPTIAAPASPALAGGNPGFQGTTQSRTAPITIDGAGNYTYRIVACNRFGKSIPVNSAAVAVVVGDMVTMVVTDGSPAGTTQWYEVYRTLPGAAAATAQYIFSTVRTAGAQTITDFNRFLPGTSKAYYVQNNLDAIGLYQLLPLTRMDLGAIDTTHRWMLLTYLAPALFAPRKHGWMFNIGPLV